MRCSKREGFECLGSQQLIEIPREIYNRIQNLVNVGRD